MIFIVVYLALMLCFFVPAAFTINENKRLEIVLAATKRSLKNSVDEIANLKYRLERLSKNYRISCANEAELRNKIILMIENRKTGVGQLRIKHLAKRKALKPSKALKQALGKNK